VSAAAIVGRVLVMALMLAAAFPLAVSVAILVGNMSSNRSPRQVDATHCESMPSASSCTGGVCTSMSLSESKLEHAEMLDKKYGMIQVAAMFVGGASALVFGSGATFLWATRRRRGPLAIEGH
jgi:hypothetical protein